MSSNLLLALMLGASIIFIIYIAIFSIILNDAGRRLRKSLQHARDRANSLRQAANNNTSLEKSYQQKRKALRNTTLLQYGITISMFIQFCGFIFIPFALLWPYCTVIYHACYNIGYVLMFCFLIAIYSPLNQVQTLFRRVSLHSPIRKDTLVGVVSDSNAPKQLENVQNIENGGIVGVEYRPVEEIISDSRDLKAIQTMKEDETQCIEISVELSS